MPKQTFYEGQTATNPQTGETIVYKAGKWAMPSSAGATALNAPADPLTPGSESRTRIVLGLGPAVEAQKNLYSGEGWKPGTANPRGSNPYDSKEATFADMLSERADMNREQKASGGIGPFGLIPVPNAVLDRTAQKVRGERVRSYTQAAKSFESAFLPILSGAAVTESEAARQIKAVLPVAGDSPATLAQKAKQRAMMINGAADLAGKPRPFPRVGVIDLANGSMKAGPTAGAPAASADKPRPIKQQSTDELMRAAGLK